MGRLSRAITWLARCSVKVIPAGRREWAAAVWAESGEVPARRRPGWVAGGLFLVAREAGMFRRIGYWLAVVALAAGAAGVVSLVWHGAHVAPGFRTVSVPSITMGNVYVDPRTTEEYRTLVIATVVLLAALPWVARRRGVFGPAAGSTAARVVRVAGCAAVCVLVLVLARLAQSLGENLGAGAASLPVRLIEMGVSTAYLAGVIALATRRWSPRWAARLPAEAWAFIAFPALAAGGVLFLLDPGWWLVTTYLTGILALTARPSGIAPATLGIGAGAGLAGGLIWYASVSTGRVFLHGNPWLVPVVVVAVFAVPVAAGVAAAWLVPDQDSPDALKARCLRQGLAAGVLTGAAAALLITISVLGTMVADHLQFGPHSTEIYLLVAFVGPLLGTAMGAIGGSGAADYRLRPRPAGPAAPAPAPVPPAI